MDKTGCRWIQGQARSPVHWKSRQDFDSMQQDNSKCLKIGQNGKRQGCARLDWEMRIYVHH